MYALNEQFGRKMDQDINGKRSSFGRGSGIKEKWRGVSVSTNRVLICYVWMEDSVLEY